MRHSKLSVVAMLAFVGACGGGTSPAASVDAGPVADVDARPTAVVRVKIAPAALLFTASGQEHLLVAEALDIAGQPIAGVVTWTSSDPAQVTVSSDGLVRSVVGIGSAQVFAEVEGVRSPLLQVIVVEAKAGAVLVSDAQVVEVGAIDAGGEYDVKLRGVPAPEVGTVVLASEGAKVGGSVASSRVEGDLTIVRLRFTTLSDLLDRYALSLSWRLEDLEWANADGSPLATAPATNLLPAFAEKPAMIEGKFPPDGSPFQCTASAAATLSKNVVDVSLSRTGTLSYVESRDDAALPPGFLRLRYEGEITLTGSIGLKAEASFDGKITCEVKKSLPIAVFGLLSLIGTPAIPVGLGVSFDGKLVVASLELTLEGKIGVKFDMGVTCGPGETPCGTFSNVDPINELKPKVKVPDADGMRVKLDGSLYLLSGLDFTVLGGFGGTYSLAEFKIGPTQSANLAFVNSQGNEKDYASSYELNIGYSLGLGSSIKNLIAYLGKGLVSVDAKLEDKVSLAKSATGTFAVDKPKIAANQKAMFTTTLERDLDYWKLGYNVESVKLYRKKENSTTYDLMATIEASPGQSRFEWQFRPTEADYGKQEFFAFVKTKFPLIELEVGNDTTTKIEVLAFCAAGPLGASSEEGLLSLPAGGCGGTLKHVTTDTIPGIGTTTDTITAQIRLVKDDETTSPYTVGFRPTGTFIYDRTGTIQDCMLRILPTSGTLPPAPNAGGLLLYTDTEPYPYDGLIGTGEFTVTQEIICPDPENNQTIVIPSWDITLFMVNVDQGFNAGPDGKTLRGSYQEVNQTRSESWEWDLTID